ncbi:MAG: hypothetical protein AAF577_01700 [Pseudomonadota bacterium]
MTEAVGPDDGTALSPRGQAVSALLHEYCLPYAETHTPLDTGALSPVAPDRAAGLFGEAVRVDTKKVSVFAAGAPGLYLQPRGFGSCRAIVLDPVPEDMEAVFASLTSGRRVGRVDGEPVRLLSFAPHKRARHAVDARATVFPHLATITLRSVPPRVPDLARQPRPRSAAVSAR